MFRPFSSRSPLAFRGEPRRDKAPLGPGMASGRSAPRPVGGMKLWGCAAVLSAILSCSEDSGGDTDTDASTDTEANPDTFSSTPPDTFPDDDDTFPDTFPDDDDGSDSRPDSSDPSSRTESDSTTSMTDADSETRGPTDTEADTEADTETDTDSQVRTQDPGSDTDDPSDSDSDPTVGDAGACCDPDPDAAGCDNEAVMDCVCEQDPFCCEDAWDEACVVGVVIYGCGVCDGVGGEGDCCSENGTPGCDDDEIEACVCEADSTCCLDGWDETCADGVEFEGCGRCP